MAMVAAGGRAAITAFLRALHTRALKLRRNHRYYYFGSSGGGSSSSSSSTASRPIFLAALFCAAAAAALFPRAVAFFLPLVASTSALCAAAAYLSMATDADRSAAKEVVLVRGEGEPAEAGTLQVYADASLYGGGGVQVGCFLRKSATRSVVDEDGEEVVSVGRLLVPAPAKEEVASLQVDRLAEGVWDSYFGRWSTWNHYALDGCDDD